PRARRGRRGGRGTSSPLGRRRHLDTSAGGVPVHAAVVHHLRLRGGLDEAAAGRGARAEVEVERPFGQRAVIEGEPVVEEGRGGRLERQHARRRGVGRRGRELRVQRLHARRER